VSDRRPLNELICHFSSVLATLDLLLAALLCIY